jgi:lipopolysaccharide biosynthesis protein
MQIEFNSTRNKHDQIARLIAFYLPQFHPIPENNAWWGPGFTEWTNVVRGRPLFRGHYQPHLPADMGFYDLRLSETREAQAELARSYAIHGFCYYHYWFQGRRMLERPFDEVLRTGRPDFPFCLCWANENWTRRWDGMDEDILIEQNYSREDDLAHIRSLLPAFADSRYIRIEGRPLFLVYRTELLPEPARTAEIWRSEASRAGLGEIYLVRVERFGNICRPGEIGFDAAVEFAPYPAQLTPLWKRVRHKPLMMAGLIPKAYGQNFIYDYQEAVQLMLSRSAPEYRCFSCVAPSWDNSARKAKNASIFLGSSPERYGQWLRQALSQTLERSVGDERIVFINAWNEWGEGCHLEPDRRYGRAYLEATRSALGEVQESAPGDPRSEAAAA